MNRRQTIALVFSALLLVGCAPKKMRKQVEFEPKEPSGTLMFLCLKEATAPDWKAAHAQLKKEIATSRLEVSKKSPDVASFFIGDCEILVTHIAAPIPGDEIPVSELYSRFWKKGDSTAHKSNVVLIGKGSRTTEIMMNTAYVAKALANANPTVCWYVGNAGHILSPAIAAELADAFDFAAIFVSVQFSKNENGGTDASTLGMERLKHREFEMVNSQKSKEDIYAFLMDTSWYALDRDPVFKDQETVGPTDEERYRIEVGPSKLGKPGTVIRVGF